MKRFLPSASTSLIMSCSSTSVGFCPSDRMTVPNSFVVMVPSPSLSNSEKASLNSEFRNELFRFYSCRYYVSRKEHNLYLNLQLISVSEHSSLKVLVIIVTSNDKQLDGSNIYIGSKISLYYERPQHCATQVYV